MAFTPNFHSNIQTHHFDTVAKHLLRSRQTGDTSKCDIRLLLRNGQQEFVHSCVIMGHSGTLASILNNCREPYAPIDLSSFDELAVRRVIDWMYCGRLQTPKTDLRALLAVAAHLRVSELQRDLENYLKSLASRGELIFALNTATADSFSVSEETVANLAITLAQSISNISDTDIASLSFNSIVAIMATQLPAEQKVPLVNMAIRWLHMEMADLATREMVTKSIVINDQDDDTLFGIQTGLIIQLKKNNFDVHLVYTRNNGVVIRSRPMANMVSRCLEPPSNQRRSRVRQTRSQLSILNAQPDPFHPNFEIPQAPQVGRNLPVRRGLTISSLSDQNVHNNQQSASDYSTFSSSSRTLRRVYPTESQIGDLHTLPDVFEGSQYARQLSNPVEQSSSLREQLAGIPDPFSPKTNRMPTLRSITPRRRNSDQSHIATIPDPFLRADIMRHNVDHEHLNQIPNPFGCRPTRSPLRRQNSDHSRLAEIPDPFVSRPTCSRKHNSDHSRVAGLPDPFAKSSEEQNEVLFKPTNSGFPKAFTKSEVEALKGMNDPFARTEKSSSVKSMQNCYNFRPTSSFSMKTCGFEKPGCRQPFSMRPPPIDENENIQKLPDEIAQVVMDVRSKSPARMPVASKLPATARSTNSRTAQDDSEKSNKKNSVRSEYLYL